MGMICSFYQVSPQKMDELPEILMESGGEAVIESLNEDEERICWIDKSWDGLNYLFCGKAVGGGFPSGFIKGAGARPVSEEGFEELPMFWFSPDKTAKIANFLKSLDREKLYANYAPQKMNEDVYPSCFIEQGDEGFNWLYGEFQKLRDFYCKAAEAGDCTATMTG